MKDPHIIDNVRWLELYRPVDRWRPGTTAAFILGAAAFSWGLVIAAVAAFL